MHDDFNALDFLSAGGFHFYPETTPSKKQKKRRGSRKAKSAKKRDLKALLPFLAHKKPASVPSVPDLEGWPVTLSWPAGDGIVIDNPEARSDYPHH